MSDTSVVTSPSLPICMILSVSRTVTFIQFRLRSLGTSKQVKAVQLPWPTGYHPRLGHQSPAACAVAANFKRSWPAKITRNCLAHIQRAGFEPSGQQRRQKRTKDNCEDWPMRIMILDVSNELNPYTLSYLPQPINPKP